VGERDDWVERPAGAILEYRADQPFDEGMRDRHVRDGLDFLHIEDPQIRLPHHVVVSAAWE
jgi:hypothetical protein